MVRLSFAVAAAAAVVLLQALSTGWSWGLGGLSLLGFGLAFVTHRSTAISTFLRIFSGIFAVEYVVLSLAHLASLTAYWPQSLAEAKPPLSLPLTIAIFGLIVFGISFIPVIRQITRLADPYFEAREVRGDATLGWFTFSSWGEAFFGRFLLVTLVVINQVQVGINLRLSFNSRDIFDALNKKDGATFWYLIFVVFVMWAAIFVISSLIEYYLESVLKMRWRTWLTERYTERWLDRGTHYRMGLFGADADNPDQRIAEDVRGFLGSTYAYSISLLSQISTLVSFSLLLWSIPAQFAIPGTSIIVPGMLFWVALIYSVLGTWLAHRIGRPLIKLDFAQERHEADFRFGLARLREYTEQTALLKGELAERQRLSQSFGQVVDNYFRLVSRNLKLNAFTAGWFQASVVFPYALVAPFYFAGTLSLGQLQQTAGAFSRVESAMSFFISRYASLASFKAIVDRLTTFGDALVKAQEIGRTPPRIEHEQHADESLVFRNLSLSLPDGRVIVKAEELALPKGARTLVVGPSGSGKSTLFRAVAGIWPFGAGSIATPVGTSALLLPQRPYIPQGTLRAAVSYPAETGAFDDAAIRAALHAVRLSHLVEQLDSDEQWAQRLSGGEQQRLAIARALLAKPDWLFLDEATAALDEPLEAEVYGILRGMLPDTTVVSIGHRSTLIALHDNVVAMHANDDGTYTPRRRENESSGRSSAARAKPKAPTVAASRARAPRKTSPGKPVKS